MLQMAESQHKGLIPREATRLSIVIPPIVQPSDDDWLQFMNEDDNDGVSIIPTTLALNKAIRAFCNFLYKPWRRCRSDSDDSVPVDAIRVRLLQEDEW